MTKKQVGTHIEDLITRENWPKAKALIEAQLSEEPEDHWLWGRLAAVKYEQREYPGALEAAEKALEIVPDCPLALWSKANAVEMLGHLDDAAKMYTRLIRSGVKQLKKPNEDANECWEGANWTYGLVADCTFRIAGCLAKTGQPDRAMEMYQQFLSLHDLPGELGGQGIYSREDALARLKKLFPNKDARREAVMKRMERATANITAFAGRHRSALKPIGKSSHE